MQTHIKILYGQRLFQLEMALKRGSNEESEANVVQQSSLKKKAESI